MIVDEKLQEYERRKKEIANRKLSAGEYEIQIKKLVQRLGL